MKTVSHMMSYWVMHKAVSVSEINEHVITYLNINKQ